MKSYLRVSSKYEKSMGLEALPAYCALNEDFGKGFWKHYKDLNVCTLHFTR